MQNVVTIGRKLIPADQIALVEPFDGTNNPDFKPERPFKARVVLVNRDTLLSELSPQEFAGLQDYQMLDEDAIAVNPAIAFQVETFTPSETFNPAKAYMTRLKWRDHDGNDQSKLLLTEPEAVIGVVHRRDTAPRNPMPQRPPRARVPRLDESSLVAE
jgi:hypothetical protein